MPHSHPSTCLVLWVMRMPRDSFCFGKRPVIDYFFAPFSWMATVGIVWSSLPFLFMKGDIRGKCCQVAGMSSAAPYISTASLALILKNLLLSIACKALCGPAPACFSNPSHTTLTPIIASNLTGFSSISLMSQVPFSSRAFVHVVPSAWNAFSVLSTFFQLTVTHLSDLSLARISS